MVLHKLVNGERIDLTPEEEKKVRAEWAANEIKHEQKRIEYEKRQALKKQAKQKLYNIAGLTVEEIEALEGVRSES